VHLIGPVDARRPTRSHGIPSCASPGEHGNGNLVVGTVDGDPETFDWSAERLLESVTGPQGTTAFVYGVDGQRLLRMALTGQRPRARDTAHLVTRTSARSPRLEGVMMTGRLTPLP
jgi:hypothetical protein